MTSALKMRPAVCLAKTRNAAKRPFTTSHRRQSQITAAEAASRLLEKFGGTISTKRQVIDGNQLQKLSLTLGRPILDGVDVRESAPVNGTPVPPGYHLVYFTPNGLESELGQDGSDHTFNPSAPFTRRMWAGGKMTWSASGSQSSSSTAIRVGDEVEERTKLHSAVAKKSRSAGEMVLVEVEKEIWGPRGLALVDQRSWIIRPEIDVEAAKERPESIGMEIRGPTKIEDVAAADKGFPSRQLCWSPVGLFRFSALTFNGHKIHYNENWTQSVEGHPGVVVHGPLNLINLLNYWRDVHGNGRWPKEVSYRAMAPVYAGEQYEIRTGEVKQGDQGQSFEIVAEKNGKTCMKSEIKVAA